PNVDTDLDKNKKEIIEFLTTEIIGRYYYQAGGIKSTLKWDDDVKKAIQVLSDDEQYTSTLHVPDKKVVTASN
ncbi:MAG: peptidase S41, partial [Bacteroidetes bacterium]